MEIEWVGYRLLKKYGNLRSYESGILIADSEDEAKQILESRGIVDVRMREYASGSEPIVNKMRREAQEKVGIEISDLSNSHGPNFHIMRNDTLIAICYNSEDATAIKNALTPNANADKIKTTRNEQNWQRRMESEQKCCDAINAMSGVYEVLDFVSVESLLQLQYWCHRLLAPLSVKTTRDNVLRKQD